MSTVAGACCCLGPQNGEPLCPCGLQATACPRLPDHAVHRQGCGGALHGLGASTGAEMNEVLIAAGLILLALVVRVVWLG